MSKYKYKILNYWNNSDDLYVNYIVEDTETKNTVNAIEYYNTSDLSCDYNSSSVEDIIDSLTELIKENNGLEFNLPKVSEASPLLKYIYDYVCESDADMCHIDYNDWEELKEDEEFIDEDINNLHQNLINYLKKLESKSRKWSKLVLSSLNDYEKKVFNCLLSSKYYEQGSPKKKHDLEIIFQKSEKVIRTFEIYNSFRKAINSQIVIPKIYYYFSEEDLAIFKYYYNNLNNLVVKSLSHARYQTLANLIDKINDIKDNKKLSFSITKLLSKIQSSTVLERENFFHSLKKEQLNVLKKATKLYEQNLDIMKNLNHEEKITYALLMRKVDEELVKVKRKHIKSIYPKQLFRFYNGEYKNIQIEKALNLLTKKEYQLLSNYLNNITDTEHENIINQIIYVKIPNLIETLEENAQTKD